MGRQENEKNRQVVSFSERLKEEKSLMQSELSVQASENTLMKTNEKRLLRDLAEYRERNKSLEEELHKVKAARSVDDLQRKELEEQLEAEQYFTTLYKTQVNELTDEVDDAKERERENQTDKEALVLQIKSLAARADSDARSRRVAEEDCAELEKEKMMIELELTEVNDKNKAALRNLEMLLASSKDTESDLLQRLDSMAKDHDDLVSKINTLQEELDKVEVNAGNQTANEMQEEMEKLKKTI